MSAAEKLRALEPRIERLPGGLSENLDSYEAKKELADALPQIVAVVEAAEEARRQTELWAEDANDGEFAIWSKDEFMGALFALRPALAALDEALE